MTVVITGNTGTPAITPATKPQVYATVLIWQTYWAIATARKTAWGTRSGRADDGLGFRIIGTIGSPQPSGIPICADVEHIGAPAPGEIGVAA